MAIQRYLKKLGALTGAGVLGAALLVPATVVPASAQPPTDFSWTSPGTYNWTVPDGVHSISVTVAGGQGGNDEIFNDLEWVGHPGGRGATITGTYEVSPGDQLRLYVASRGGTGLPGGGDESASAGGTGYRNGGGGGSGSSFASFGQGGGGGGGASALSINGTLRAVAGGGGGAGGTALCGGNPGGHAGGNGWKPGNNCPTDGGDWGLAGQTSSGHGEPGNNARSSSGQGGGGGGGGGVRGGSGADASYHGGGGGGGGTSMCSLDGCSTTASNYGHGSIRISAIHTPVVTFDEATYGGMTGTPVTFSGEVAAQHANGGTPQGTVTLLAVDEDNDTEPLATVPVSSQGRFEYDCTAPCGLTSTPAQVRADFATANSNHWSNASGTADFELASAYTQTALHIDPTAAVTGQERDFTATVSVLQPAQGVVTGDVEFYMSAVDGSQVVLLGTAPLAPNYQATLTTGVPEALNHRFWAAYVGTAGFHPSESPKRTLLTDPADTSVTAATVPNPTVTGEDFEIEVEVAAVSPGAGAPTGDVRVQGPGVDVSVPLAADGTATAPVPGRDAGAYEFVVTYEGDGNYLPSQTLAAHTVERAAVALLLDIDSPLTQFGEEITLTASAGAILPGRGEVTGEVVFGYQDEDRGFVEVGESVELVEGAAELTVAGLDVGTYEFETRYAETANFLAATSEPVAHEIVATATTTTVTPLPATNTYSLPQQVLVEVSGSGAGDVALAAAAAAGPAGPAEGLPADGEVQLIQVALDGTETELGAPTVLDEAGTAAIDVGLLDPATYEVYAVYGGSGNFIAGESSPATFEIEKAHPNVVLAVEADAVIGDAHDIVVRVTPIAIGDDGAAELDFVPTGTVDVAVDGELIAEALELVADGTGGFFATVELTHEFSSAGAHRLVATYSGDDFVVAGDSDAVTVTATEVPQDPAPAPEPPAGITPGEGLPSTGVEGSPAMLAAAGALLLLAGIVAVRRGQLLGAPRG